MERVGVVGSGKSQVIAALTASRGIDVVFVGHGYKRGVWEILAIDECTSIDALYKGKERRGKGQRKANRANRWR
jgi:hypothetical protein